MITAETLRASESLSDLTDAQVNEILTQVQTRIGEIHGGYDKDFSEVLGIQKPPGSGSSYTFWKQQVGELKKAADKAKELSTQVEDLKGKIKAGGGDQKLIKELEADKAGLISQLDEWKSKEEDWKTKLSELETKNFDIQLGSFFNKALSDLKTKPEIGDVTKRLSIEAAERELRSQYQFKLNDSDGGKVLQITKNGAPVDATLSELFKGTKALGEIIDTGRQQPGGGSTPPGGSGGEASVSGGIVNVPGLAGAKTRLEARTMIDQALAAQSIAKTDPKYPEIVKKTWEEVVQPLNLPLK